MKRFNKSIWGIVSFSLALSTRNSFSENRPPNVVMILTDDQGWGDLSVSGNSNLQTPHIDQLAERGVTFEHFYVCPVSSPTRAELLTGRYHPRGGVYSTSRGGERLDLDETTMAEIFKNAGYVTAAYGKWHSGTQPPYHPNARGFDDFYGFCSGHWGNYFAPTLEHNSKIVQGKGYIIDDFTDHALEFIEQNKENPFFLYLPYNTPHSPMQVPDQWWNKFKNKELSMRHYKPEEEDVLFTRAALAMCENIDWNVGRIMKKIEDLGLAENTLIVYFSDNGPNSWRWNGGMKGRKGSTDEGGVRSPLFLKWEGVLEGGKKIGTITAVIDLLPTLADMAGIDLKTDKPLDGVSLKPLLTSTNCEWEERFVFSHWNGKISVRSQRFRLDDEGRLFDMEHDAGQTIDVSASFPEIVRQMKEARAKWERDVLSELPVEDTRPFSVGFPSYGCTILPARDGMPHGNIKRSSRFPNCSFFTDWISLSDSITWEVEVLEAGDFEVEIYYTCPLQDVGSTVELLFAGEKLAAKIADAHDPPLIGMENDRVKRTESYVKDFKPLKMGVIHLKKGKGILSLKAVDIPRSQVMNFWLLILKRI